MKCQPACTKNLSQTCDLSVIIPARNEENRLPNTLELLTNRLALLGVSYELIVVDDGSQDNTVGVARAWKANIVEHGNGKGIAASFRSGVRKSHGKIVMLCPADIYDFSFLDDAMKATQSFDVISVSKRHKKSIVLGYTKLRWFLSNGYDMCVKLLFGRFETCTDTHYIKLYNRRMLAGALRKCRLNGPVGETEIMLYSKDLGCRFFEIPGKIIHNGNGSKTSVGLILRTVNELVCLLIQRRLKL
jgi:glycosyltransferase involved in cell wall biosynthesis